MEPSETCYHLIKDFEGLRCRAYKPVKTEKYFTIGYGHCGPDVQKNQVITVQQAESLLHEDVAKVARKVEQFCPCLEQHQFDALVSLVYNIGWYNFKNSMTGILARNLNVTSKPIEVARRIILWTKAGGQTLLGLLFRRMTEANVFLGENRFKVKDSQIVEILCEEDNS